MKRIVSEVSKDQILSSSLRGDEIVAYRCNNSTNQNIAVLCKLHRECVKERFGFINLGNPTCPPSYISENFFQSINLAKDQRKLYTFDDQKELILAIFHEKI